MNKTLKAMAVLISDRWKEPSVCEACGNDFTCGATLSGCWCSDVKLTPDERNQLQNRYKNCLCRTCLEKVGNKD
ncbi:MAG TPA: cysteine-rich CWC family protein [Pyrinomonadaceae bacterium]|nr:cysteine-rich CWC family protein [Pyrinomonadaceae bacterium]